MDNSNGNESDREGDGERNKERVEGTTASKLVLGNAVMLSTLEKVKPGVRDGVGTTYAVSVSCSVPDTISDVGATIDDTSVIGNSTELESSGKKVYNITAEVTSDCVTVTWGCETRLSPAVEDTKTV